MTIEFFTYEDVLVDAVNFHSVDLKEEQAEHLVEHEANKNEAIEYGNLYFADGTMKAYYVTGY
jgi:hypothetical protein